MKKITLEHLKVILMVLAWFMALAIVAVTTGCSRAQYVKKSDSQHRMSKASSWTYNEKR